MTPGDVQPAAVPAWYTAFLARGFKLVFYARGTKHPEGRDGTDWPARCTDSCSGFVADRNAGVLVGGNTAREGESPRYLADVDLDSDESIRLANAILPPTDFGFGHGAQPITHLFYTTSNPVVSVAFSDPITKKKIVELRGTKKDGTLGYQTMLPPSVHPNGDVLAFPTDCDGAIGHDDTIVRRVPLLAVATLLAIHLGPRGLLHDVRLATAGFLLHEGVPEDDVIRIGVAVARYTRNDEKDVVATVRSTIQRIAAGKRILGAGELSATFGPHGEKILARIREWIGSGDWERSKNGAIIPNHEQNVRAALGKLNARLSYNAFADRILLDYHSVTGPLDDFRRNRLWLDIDKVFRFRPGTEFFQIVLHDVAWSARFHPVVQYLDGLTWDGTPRLDTWLITYAEAKDSPYTRTASALPLIAAVRRVRRWERDGGVKFDELLILESSQGLNKSTALRTLCPDDAWFSDDLPLGVDSKMVIERTAGKWIIEAAEMAMRPHAVDHLKASLSRQVDGPVRLAYARESVERARQFVVIGTTNSDRYLKDPTGARRFWPVKVKAFDVESLRRDRDQLWAEAAHREAAGASIRMAAELWAQAEDEQEKRRRDDPWEDILATAIEDSLPYVEAQTIWDALGKLANQLNNTDADRVDAIMQRLGFTEKRRLRIRHKATGTNRRPRCWIRGEVQGDIFEDE